MKLSIIIMAHPKRKQYVPYLLSKLGPDAKVVFDEKNNLWDTCRRSWLATDRDSDYTLIIQDDALVCNNFIEKAKEFLKEDFVYSFYAGDLLANRIEKAKAENKQLVFSDMIVNEIALCMKTKHVENMVKYCDERNAQNDHLISTWAFINRKRIAYTVPSLIDHRDEKSIYRENYKINLTKKQRKAYFYVDRKN